MPTCNDGDAIKLWDYQVIWDPLKVSKMSNLIISVNPMDPTNSSRGLINVRSVQNSNGSYNIDVDETFSFIIRGTLPNN
jgi:hypothetical protein